MPLQKLTTLQGPLRRRLAWAILGLVVVGGPLALPRHVVAGPPRRDLLDESRRRAIRRGCEFIAEKQRPDGGFGDNKAVVAVTALSVLALMSDGSTDGRGPHGDRIKRGIDFLLRLVTEPRGGSQVTPGYFYCPEDNNSRMHGQGFATLALASALGTSSGERYRQIRGVVEKAVACIQQAQTDTGGFGYEPTPGGEHEGSVTVTVAQGLRAARDAGILVDGNVIKRGLHYLKRSQNKDGSFRYSVHMDRSSYALTAAALSSFYLFGEYRDDADRTLQRGLKYLMDSLGETIRTGEWLYYGNFYAAWTTWQKDGDRTDTSSGGYWARWHDLVYRFLIDRQRSDGSWQDDADRFGFGPTLATTFAVLTLAIPDEQVPIFQR